MSGVLKISRMAGGTARFGAYRVAPDRPIVGDSGAAAPLVFVPLFRTFAEEGKLTPGEAGDLRSFIDPDVARLAPMTGLRTDIEDGGLRELPVE